MSQHIKSIAIIEDHVDILVIIKSLLIREFNGVQIREFYTCKMAEEYYNYNNFPDLLISDLKTSSEISLEIHKRMCDAKIPVVIYTGFDDYAFICALKELGVNAIVSKVTGINILAESIKSVLHREFYYCSRIEEIIKNRKTCIKVGGMPNLNKSEKVILEMIIQGFENEKIADELCMSYHTVRAHRRNMIGRNKCTLPSLIHRYILWYK